MTEIKAHTRYLRMSPRKVRLVVDIIRGMEVAPALSQLRHMSKAAALPVEKLLRSAMANAEHNAKLDAKTLFIKSIVVNQGPTLKRFRPRAMGASAPILKRTSHVSIVLAPKEESKKEKEAAKEKEPERSKKAPSAGGQASAKKKAAAPAKKKETK